MKHPTLLAAALSLFAAPAFAQLRINEVLIDPVGPNTGNQIVEIQNVSGAPFTAPADWTFCIRPLYPLMPQIQIPTDGIVRVHVGATGTDTATDWFLPFVPGLQNDSEFALYQTDLFFTDPTLIMDFVSWGNGATPTNSRITTAVQAGLWPDNTTHLPLPAEGSSLARLGSGSGPDSFYTDSTPTIGAPNLPAFYETFGNGCAGSAGVPDLHAAVPGSRPWLGAPYGLEVTNVPGPFAGGLLLLALSEAPPTPLQSFGAPGCTGYLNPAVSVFGGGAGAIPFAISLPLDPALEGTNFVTQVLVLDQGVNGLGAVFSNAARGRAGLQ